MIIPVAFDLEELFSHKENKSIRNIRTIHGKNDNIPPNFLYEYADHSVDAERGLCIEWKERRASFDDLLHIADKFLDDKGFEIDSKLPDALGFKGRVMLRYSMYMSKKLTDNLQ